MLHLMPLWVMAAGATEPALMIDPTADPSWEGEDWADGIDVDQVLRDVGLDVDGSGVVGGTQANSGKWDDAVGIVFGGQYVGCTGTLVGPKVVITAGHCVGGISHVIVGSTNWVTDEGEVIAVERSYEYPNSQSTYDIAVLTLEEKSSYEPRPIAVECVLKDHLSDGANAQIVGYGVTTESGDGWNTRLNEAPTVILDKNCDEFTVNGVASGCNMAVSPGGEIAAGGNGTDACYGDSGGPLYLKTGGEGTYLVGVTSRAFIGVDFRYPCRDGGIWVRPDAVIDWIEEQAGNKTILYPSCNDAPEPVVDEIITFLETPGTTLVQINDPDGEDNDALITVVQEPENGSVTVDPDGTLVYTPDAGFVGDDGFTVEVVDGGVPSFKRTGDPVAVELDVPVQVQEGAPPGEGGGIGGALGGCSCDSGTSAPGAVGMLALLGLVGLRRRG